MSSPLRTAARKIHLFLGLTAGSVILLLCLTGALLSFEPEVTHLRHPEFYGGAAVGIPVPLSRAVDSMRAVLPADAQFIGVTMSSDPTVPWEFVAQPIGRIFVDPATGHVIGTTAFRAPFFQKTMELHRWLLADDLGGAITGAATLMFVILLLMGLILWWPRTRGAFKARINPFNVFSKHGGGRRKLHDLHVALGIWCWPVLFLVALTAMPLAYDWAGAAVMTVTRAPRPAPQPRSTSDSTAAPLSIDSIAALGRTTFPDARLWSVRLASRRGGAAAVSSVAKGEPSERRSSTAYFDRATGATLRIDRWEDLSTGYHLRRMMEVYHSGGAWGLPGRTLWFFVVLLGASFPVTGFLMYRAGRKAS